MNRRLTPSSQGRSGPFHPFDSENPYSASAGNKLRRSILDGKPGSFSRSTSDRSSREMVASIDPSYITRSHPVQLSDGFFQRPAN